MHLLVGAQPGEDDPDVLAGAFDEVLGDVQDPHWFTHVEDQDVGGPPDGTGLDGQLAGLGNGHEVARDLGMGDRDGTALLDLAGEGVQHRPARPENVAEPHGQPGATGLAGVEGGQFLREAFGLAEHRGGVGGLVCGDVDQTLDPVLLGCAQHVEGADGVGLPAFEGILLEHRQVLQRGGVEHHVGTVVGEDLVEGLDVTDVAQHHVGGVQEALVVDGQLGSVQAGLVAVQHDQFLRPEPVELAGQLGADGAAGPGDEHHLAGQVVGDLPEVRLDLGAPQQVGYVELVQVPQADAARDEVLRGGHHQRLQARLVGQLGDLAHERAVGGGDGDDDLVDAVGPGDGDHVPALPEDFGSLDVEVALGRVVVDVTDDLIGRVGVVGEQPPELLACVARTVDEDRFPALVVLGGAADGAEQETARRHQHQRRQRHGEGHHPRVAGGREEDREDPEHQTDPEGD